MINIGRAVMVVLEVVFMGMDEGDLISNNSK